MLPVQVMDIVLNVRSRELQARAERSRRAHKGAGDVVPEAASAPVRIRRAQPEDRDGLAVLAELDGHRRPLQGPVLVAELGGRLVAARSLEDGSAVADPFSASAGPAALLRLRAEQVMAPARVEAGRRLAPRLRRRAA
jgi:hypothetical protein